MKEFLIGQKIKKMREFRNFTQEHLAKSLDMTQAGYSRIERDEVDVTIKKLVKIAKILDVTINDLFSFDDTKIFQNQFSNKERELFEKLLESKENEIETLKKCIS